MSYCILLPTCINNILLLEIYNYCENMFFLKGSFYIRNFTYIYQCKLHQFLTFLQTCPQFCLWLFCCHVYKWCLWSQARRDQNGRHRPQCTVGSCSVCIYRYCTAYIILPIEKDVDNFVCYMPKNCIYFLNTI